MRPRAFAPAALVPALLVLTLLTAGCTTAGTPLAGESANVLFDPCNIPDATLREAGVGEFLDRGILGGPYEEWDACRWSGRQAYLTVLSTTYDLAAIRADPKSYDFRPITINDRAGVSYQTSIEDPGTGCDVAYSWARGSVIVSVTTPYGDAPLEPPCDAAVRYATTFEPALPQP